jgi:uncharacterized protein YidB (DUF937 family)
MGLLDGVMGGLVGAGATALVQGYIEKHGGIAAVVSQLTSSGLGEQAKSWVGTGANLPVSAAQIQQVLGSGGLSELGAKFGISPDKISELLAQHLPQAIDQATPSGKLP